MEEMFIKTTKGHICVRTQIIKERPVILFLHGGSSSLKSGELLKPYFDRYQYSQIYVDLRGHGKSYRPVKWSEYRLENHVKDINAILKTLNIKKVNLIGHSLGGMIAATFASLYPKKVEKLILINPGINKHLPFFNRFTKRFFLYLYYFAKLLKINHPDNLKRVNYQSYIGTGDLSFRRLIADYQCTGPMTILAQTLAFFSWSPEKTYGSIISPTLIIRGKYDILFTNSVTNHIKKTIRNSQIVSLKTGHASITNKPKLIANSIINFLKMKI